jgi:hypothetical protein
MVGRWSCVRAGAPSDRPVDWGQVRACELLVGHPATDQRLTPGAAGVPARYATILWEKNERWGVIPTARTPTESGFRLTYRVSNPLPGPKFCTPWIEGRLPLLSRPKKLFKGELTVNTLR